MKLTIEGATSWEDLGFDKDDLNRMVAEALADRMIGRFDAQEIDKLLKAGIRKAVGQAISGAISHPIGAQPLTLIEAIQAEARAQISRGDAYQGVSTPLKHVVAAEVYRVLHDEIDGFIQEAREKIKAQMPQEVAKLVQRSFGSWQL